MPTDTKIDSSSKDFKANSERIEEQLREIRKIERLVIEKSQEQKAEIAKKKKLLPRERLEKLLDQRSPFLELSSLAGYKMHDDEDGSLAGGGLIAGIGFVEGTRCMVVAHNYTIKGGTISPSGLAKTLRIHEIVLANRLPLVTLSESGGANLNYAAEIFVPGARIFANQSRLSAAGVPQITVVHGNATAGGAYQPGLSDYIILIEGQSKMFLGGPPLVKAAIGETATDEELGGASMHARVSGTGEFLVKNDLEAIQAARKIVKNLDWRVESETRKFPEFKEPLHPVEELMGVVPLNPKKPYDVREIIARITDGSEFDEFKAEYDRQTLCARAPVHGRICGIIGNNGPITAHGAGKAAQFIELCEQSRTPIVFLHNTTGFMVGTDAEQSGIIKQGSKLIQAVANASVPKISFVIGGSFGAGNYAMCGRGLDPRFIFSWPNSRTAVMGGEQAGKVLRIVAEEKARRQGKEPDAEKLAVLEKKTAENLNESSTALFGSARLWDDGVIDPRETRKILAFVLETCREGELRKLGSNTFGVPRH